MFKRVIGVAVVVGIVGVGLSTVTQSSVPAFAPQFATCTVNCLQVKPVSVTKFSQLSESNDIQPALGVNVLQRTESPQKELGE